MKLLTLIAIDDELKIHDFKVLSIDDNIYVDKEIFMKCLNAFNIYVSKFNILKIYENKEEKFQVSEEEFQYILVEDKWKLGNLCIIPRDKDEFFDIEGVNLYTTLRDINEIQKISELSYRD